MRDENPRDDAGKGESTGGIESTTSTVGELMEERRRYDLWLGALEAKRAETPKHVYSRVHADYTSRLESVIGRLSGQIEGLRSELTTLTTRIASIEEQQHRARDERAEAELRAHVGETTASEWETAAAKADALIADLGRQHVEAEDALARTRDFLANAERPATPAVAAAPIAASPTAGGADTSAEPPLAPSRGTTNVPVQRTAPGQVPVAARLRPLPGREDAPGVVNPPAPRAANFDELAFLNSVVDEDAPPEAPAYRPTAAAHVEPVARPAPPPSRNPFAQRAQDKIINNDGAAGPKIESKRAAGKSGLASNVSGNNPIVLRDKSNEASKTLKCGECGATNYPTEWYCERCGAELATM
ncbi:MAG: hypothetical protein LH467_01960 [Gemmatimonadaceae bacterium]|nr:hypothetical protein [Gemmatimonadaceae bacterium]